MASLGEVAALLLVGALWGGTTPWLKRGAEGLEAVRGETRAGQLLAEMRFLWLHRQI